MIPNELNSGLLDGSYSSQAQAAAMSVRFEVGRHPISVTCRQAGNR